LQELRRFSHADFFTRLRRPQAETEALFVLTVEKRRLGGLINDNERDLNQRETGGDSSPDSLGRITPKRGKKRAQIGCRHLWGSG
jgi:hypothetical protein